MIQLLINGDDYLLQRHLKKTLETLVDPATRDFNFDRIVAKDVSPAKLLDLMQTLPMMAQSRTVVVDGFDLYFKKSEKDGDSASDVVDNFIAYFKAPNPQTNLILLVEKLAKNTRIYKTIASCGDVFEFKTPYDNKIPDFVRSEAKEMGLILAPGVAEELAQTVGPHLRAVVGELEKLALYVHPERRIEVSHLRELVSQGVLDNIFYLTRLIGSKKYASARDISHRLTEQGEPIIKILSLVVAHFRKLKLLKSRLQRGPTADAEMAALLGVPPFFVRDYQDQVRLFSPIELTKIYKKLTAVSEDLRTTGASNHNIWEGFLQDVCVQPRA